MQDSPCSVSRSLGVIGEKWTLLVIREALVGTTRFADFRETLGIAGDVLSDRLTTLVDWEIMTRVPYQEPGSRPRHEYQLTDAGRALHVVVGALQQWGDEFLPWPDGPSIERRAMRTDRPVHVAFVDDLGYEIPADAVATIETSAHPNVRRARAAELDGSKRA
jgi:DNA-binding HxlR family transcriptional regulator